MVLVLVHLLFLMRSRELNIGCEAISCFVAIGQMGILVVTHSARVEGLTCRQEFLLVQVSFGEG